MNSKQVLDEAKVMIREFIDDFCNGDDSPFVCDLASTEAGYKELEKFILYRMSVGDRIDQAVNLKEQLLNPNRLAD
jgi:hypothetical protein